MEKKEKENESQTCEYPRFFATKAVVGNRREKAARVEIEIAIAIAISVNTSTTTLPLRLLARTLDLRPAYFGVAAALAILSGGVSIISPLSSSSSSSSSSSLAAVAQEEPLSSLFSLSLFSLSRFSFPSDLSLGQVQLACQGSPSYDRMNDSGSH